MTAKSRKTGGINLSGAFANAGASIVTTAATSMPAYAQHVADTGEIAPNPLNERDIDPDSADIQRLAKSMKTDGQLQAIPVVPRAEFLAWEGFDRYAKEIGSARYVVIGGGRRRAAAEVAGLPRMDISIKSGLSREAFLRITLVENIEREDLTPLQEARQIQRLREATGDSYAAIGALLHGRTKGWVAQRLDLLKLSKRLQADLASDAEGTMTTTQARRLLKLIRDEAGESDDATVSEERQWELWVALRDGERLPGKRPDDPLPAAAPIGAAASTASGAADLGGSTGSEPAVPDASAAVDLAVPASRTSADSGASPPVPTQPKSRVDQAALVRVDTPVPNLVRELRARLSPEKWSEFVAEVNTLAG